VRTGLVVLGIVIAILGVGLVITLFFLSGGPSTTTQTNLGGIVLPPGANFSGPATSSSSVPESITLSWTSTTPANVALIPATACGTSYCPSGGPELTWSNVTTGKGTLSSPDSSAYLLRIVNPGNVSLRFSAGISVSFAPPAPVPVWAWWLIAGGGVVLLGIGGIALFLGLFLPGGVYSPEGPPPEGRRPLDLPPDDLEDEGPRSGP
jgi:hypothetical protein